MSVTKTNLFAVDDGILLACGRAYFSWSAGRYGEDSAWPAWAIQGDRTLILLLVTTEVDQLCHHGLLQAGVCGRREGIAWKGGNGGPLGLAEDASKANESAVKAGRKIELTRGSRCGEADRLMGDNSCDSGRHHCRFLLCILGVALLLSPLLCCR